MKKFITISFLACSMLVFTNACCPLKKSMDSDSTTSKSISIPRNQAVDSCLKQSQNLQLCMNKLALSDDKSDDNMIAQYYLGLMYYSGYHVKQSYKQALYWYTKSANQGLAQAQYYLGVIFDEGHGVSSDYIQAIKWYTKSANQGLAQAQSNLGFIYAYGYGITKSTIKAYAWLSLAIHNGDSTLQDYLNTIKQKMSASEISNGKVFFKKLLANNKPLPYTNVKLKFKFNVE